MKSRILLLALAALSGAAYADNISLRLSYGDSRTGLTFTPVHAEIGKFAVTPNLPAASQGAQWRVVAKNAQGVVLHEVRVNNAQQRHVEVFNPKSGGIELSEQVHQASGVFEVSLPFTEGVASVEVLPVGGGLTAMKAGAETPLAKFDRTALEKVASSSRLVAAKTLASLASVAPTATTIIETGPSATRMDYVFVGDGYTASEMGKWQADAKMIIDGFMADPLFAANRASMNVRRVDVVSNQSGVDEPDKGIYRDTAMDGAFNCYNIERLLCVDNAKVLNLVGSVLSPDKRDVIIVVSNSTRYGGSGGEVATLSMHAQSVEIALHEIGHTAFKLADEYDYGTCDVSTEPSEGDVSRVSGRNVKWGSQILASTTVPTAPGSYANGTIGTFQGAQYCTTGKYRPTENSRMRSLGQPWHGVNERLAKSVFGKYGSAGGLSQTGTLASGGTANVPSSGYVQTGAGLISLQLSGPASADFDLALYKWSGSAWTMVAQSNGPTSTESISYNGSAGYYYAQVKSYSGTGSYSINYSFPPL
jgi:hypothetical protein